MPGVRVTALARRGERVGLRRREGSASGRTSGTDEGPAAVTLFAGLPRAARTSATRRLSSSRLLVVRLGAADVPAGVAVRSADVRRARRSSAPERVRGVTAEARGTVEDGTGGSATVALLPTPGAPPPNADRRRLTASFSSPGRALRSKAVLRVGPRRRTVGPATRGCRALALW